MNTLMDILTSYADGRLSRGEAMNLCGFTWFGQLMDAMKEASIPMPAPSAEYTKKMTDDVVNIFKESE